MPQSAHSGRAGASPLQGALLALLLDEQELELSGYKLTTLLARRLGPAWEVHRQSVYRALDKLVVDGLVSTTERAGTVEGRARHGQRVYRATARAEAARRAWIEGATSRGPMRDELQAKIAVSRGQDAPLLLRALDAYERSCFEVLRRSGEAEVPMGSWSSVSINLARAAVDESIKGDLQWVSKARSWIEEYVAASQAGRSQ
jgi:DNA-binding PadR family transcriptional regulator